MADGLHWISAHIHFAGDIYTAAGDDIIRCVVEPFVRQQRSLAQIERFFFIRYREDGPHIRLRLCGDRSVLKERVAPALVERTANESHGYDSGHLADLELRWCPYVPETDRYGGPFALSLAEQFFEYSSLAAFSLLRQVPPEPRSVRLGRAVLATLGLVHGFFPDKSDAVRFLHSYAEGCLARLASQKERQESLRQAFNRKYEELAHVVVPYVREAWVRLQAEEAVSPILATLQADMKSLECELRALHVAGRLRLRGLPCTDWVRARYFIIPSYVHMMNNRLGVNVFEEAYLAYLAACALS